MKICKSFHPIKSYECGAGSLKLNLFNGSYTYSYPLLSIGRNSFSVSISLVYNSTYNSNDFGSRLIGFGNGWKLDIEQHLFPYIETYNINGYNFRDYVYIDANWSIHRFVYYKTIYNGDITTNYYYDDSGTGLIMKKCGDSLLIEDEYSNQYIFENGRLVEIISSVNRDIRKIIEYNSNNNITSYYDVRKQNRKISFNYSGSALISINNTLNAKSYSINYDVDKIIEFVSTNQSTSKSIHKFIYNNDKIEYVVNSIDLEALKLVYSNTNELFRISSGAMKSIVDTQEDNAELYCGDESYVGEGDYVTNTVLTNKGIVYSMPTNYINTINQYVYHISSTEETNKFGIVIIHSFDVDGRLLCSLENMEQNNYCSLEKTIGRIISEEGQSSIHFNGKKVMELNSSNNYSYWIFDDCDSCLFTNFLHTLNKSSDLHTLSFYIMFSNDNASDQIIDIDCYFEYTDNNFTKQTIISKVKGNSWQKVEIPLNFNRKQMSLTAIKISLHNTTIGIAYISEVMIKEGGVSGIYIDGLLNNSFKEIQVGSIIYLDSNLYTISPSFYVTKNDLFATYKSLFLDGANNGRFNFYCNNKTRIIGVVDASLDTHNNLNYSFEINNGIPNFHFALADYLDKFEDQNSTLHTQYLLSEEQYRFHVDGNKYYYELKQSTGVINDYNYNERLADSNAKYNLSYLWVNSDGTERARKSVRFLNNNEIHTITHNYYDEYGNHIQTKTYDDNNLTGENITNSYSYSPDKELLTSINENGIISNIFYDNILNIDYIVTNNLKKKFNYGDDNQIESIDFINNNTGIELSTNMIVKGKHERISILKDTSGNSCGFLYNGIGNICRLTVNNRINTIFKKDELNNNICYQSKTYKQSN